MKPPRSLAPPGVLVKPEPVDGVTPRARSLRTRLVVPIVVLVLCALTTFAAAEDLLTTPERGVLLLAGGGVLLLALLLVVRLLVRDVLRPLDDMVRVTNDMLRGEYS